MTRETAGEVCYSAIEVFRALLDDAEKAVKELARSGPVRCPMAASCGPSRERARVGGNVDKAADILQDKYGPEAIFEAIRR